MLRDYRSIIAAFAVLAALAVAFGLGLYFASLNYPKEDRHQSYRYAADKPLEIDRASPNAEAKPFEYRAPCENPKGEDESDLCAQWRAAKAAENNALWAKWSFWVTGFGIAGLLITIVQGRSALERAQSANQIAMSALRPWVKIAIEPVQIHCESGDIDLTIKISLANVGQMVAIRAIIEMDYYAIDPRKAIQYNIDSLIAQKFDKTGKISRYILPGSVSEEDFSIKIPLPKFEGFLILVAIRCEYEWEMSPDKWMMTGNAWLIGGDPGKKRASLLSISTSVLATVKQINSLENLAARSHSAGYAT